MRTCRYSPCCVWRRLAKVEGSAFGLGFRVGIIVAFVLRLMQDEGSSDVQVARMGGPFSKASDCECEKEFSCLKGNPKLTCFRNKIRWLSELLYVH